MDKLKLIELELQELKLEQLEIIEQIKNIAYNLGYHEGSNHVLKYLENEVANVKRS